MIFILLDMLKLLTNAGSHDLLVRAMVATTVDVAVATTAVAAAVEEETAAAATAAVVGMALK